MSVSVVDATRAGRGLDAFLDLPRAIHSDGPASRATLAAGLARPERQRPLVVLEYGRPLARLVARVAPALRDDAGRPYGLVGHFEALDRPDAATPLFLAACAWLRAQGVRTVVGPMDRDTWHHYRLNLGPHAQPPFFLEPTNPGYYPRLFAAAGFAPVARYRSVRVDDLKRSCARLARGAARARAAGYTLRPLADGDLARGLRLVHRIAREAFAANYLYSDLGVDEFVRLYEGIGRLLAADEPVWIAHAPDGAPAGFLFAFAEPRRPDTLNLKTVGVVPGHTGRGVASLLAHHVYREALHRGVHAALLCLLREGNPSVALAGGAGRVFREYAVYGRTTHGCR